MRRRLILMRHAQSEHGASSDHARSLNGRGQKDARAVGRCLASRGWEPEAALSSDAERTRQTWAVMASAMESDLEPQFSRALYLGSLDEVWTEAQHLSPEVETALLLGHNPGWGQALYRLTGRTEHLTPATAALLHGEGETWPDALEGRWELVELIRPTDLRDPDQGV
jgi:phosphohistidine phosphatase